MNNLQMLICALAVTASSAVAAGDAPSARSVCDIASPLMKGCGEKAKAGEVVMLLGGEDRGEGSTKAVYGAADATSKTVDVEGVARAKAAAAARRAKAQAEDAASDWCKQLGKQ